MEQWNATGSGWEVEKIELFYVKIARYDPLGVGSYLPLPENLAKKNAIIYVKNRDNECPEVGSQSRVIPSKRWEKRVKTKQISGQRRDKLRRNRLPNTGKTDRQARGAKQKPCNKRIWLERRPRCFDSTLLTFNFIIIINTNCIQIGFKQVSTSLRDELG